jgi:hypothetical protein
MEKPSFTSYFLVFVTSALGAATVWAFGGRAMLSHPLWQVIVAYGVIAVSVVVVYQWRLWKWRKPWLDEKIPCPGPCESDVPRRKFLINPTFGRYGKPMPYACPACYRSFLEEDPKKGKKAFKKPVAPLSQY